ncbi:MAG TPA: hypothetical protein VGY56_00670 [Verrucomicrobiae bacterium]|nr:hypothetical protein [Verrucomicrobiae bacterium]
MDDEDASPKRDPENLGPRPPVQNDLVALCRELNQRGARYVVVGGFAIIAAGFARLTGVIDLLVAADPENEAKVFSALSKLPDNKVKELWPGELNQYMVLRVGDEIIVDLMRMAGGIDCVEAAKDIVVHELDGISIPFASPRSLWRMKANTHRAKEEQDLLFLRHWFAERGEQPPDS